MLKIVTVPNKVLTTSTKPVKTIDKKILKFLEKMEETLNVQVDPQGVGLAAPQVGVDLSLFIVKQSLKAKTEVYINPQIMKTEHIIRHSGGSRNPGKNQMDPDFHRDDNTKNTKLEGCLSIPRIWSAVKRPERVLLKYQDMYGDVKEEWFTGFKAVIIQHEVDHLHGILFTQRALEQKNQLYEEKNGELEKMEY